MNTTELSTISATLPNGKLATFTLYENGTRAAAIRKLKSGERFLLIGEVLNGTIMEVTPVPVGIAGMLVGKDAWAKKVHVKCKYCDNRPMVSELEADELCPECYEKAGEENRKMDEG